LRRTPADGAACGIMARRALTRGAWIAPANELWSGVVALTPPIARARWQDLQEAQINLIRQEPRGFVSLSADTLSDDEDLRPINVRRLLILLRRLALKLGATYVFEPNDDAFQRLVQRGFEAMLGQMFARGAFAGDTPSTAFQVVTSSSLNTPQSLEQGRFIVELRIAPSLPMTFLTIRLVQTGDRGVVTEVS
jgi:phage tail sheath protein FI